MADLVFNVAKGRVNELHDRVNSGDPSTSRLVVVLLKGAESDAGLKDRPDLAAILANGNAEADFTNYARKVIGAAGIGPSVVDNGADRREADITADPTWTAAGGVINNALVKLLICYTPDQAGGTDADLVPLTAHDFQIATNGSDLVAQLAAAGYFRAS